MDGFRRTTPDLIQDFDYTDRANCYAKLGRFDEALRDYNAALRLKKTPWNYAKRAACYADRKDFDAAFRDIQSACRMLDDDPDRYQSILEARLKCYEGLGMTDDAAETRAKLDALSKEPPE
jgi:tetratricopeptide (TPR) repeat protein